jgi:hypothetical protein
VLLVRTLWAAIGEHLMRRMAAALPWALLGSGGLSAASLGLIHAGNAIDEQDEVSSSEKLQAVAAALAGMGIGGLYGAARQPTVVIQKAADGSVSLRMASDAPQAGSEPLVSREPIEDPWFARRSA